MKNIIIEIKSLMSRLNGRLDRDEDRPGKLEEKAEEMNENSEGEKR